MTPDEDKSKEGCGYGRTTRNVLMAIAAIWLALAGTSVVVLLSTRAEMRLTSELLKVETKAALQLLSDRISIESNQIAQHRETLGRLDERLKAIASGLTDINSSMRRIEYATGVTKIPPEDKP